MHEFMKKTIGQDRTIWKSRPLLYSLGTSIVFVNFYLSECVTKKQHSFACYCAGAFLGKLECCKQIEQKKVLKRDISFAMNCILSFLFGKCTPPRGSIFSFTQCTLHRFESGVLLWEGHSYMVTSFAKGFQARPLNYPINIPGALYL